VPRYFQGKVEVVQKSDKENVTSVLGVQVDQEKGEAELED